MSMNQGLHNTKNLFVKASVRLVVTQFELIWLINQQVIFQTDALPCV